MSDSENEGDQPGTFLEREEGETLQGRERLWGPEETVDELTPRFQEPFVAQEPQTERMGYRIPRNWSCVNVEQVLNCILMLEEFFSQISISGAPSTAGKNLTCSDCGKIFTQPYSLTVHERIHTGEKPYTCSDCNKSFAHGYAFRKHQRIHPALKPYKCSECGKSFKRSPSLAAHKTIHTGERPYICFQCGKSFRSYYHLTVHVRVHPEMM